MADVSKIKLPSGTTYNIKDTVSGYTTNTGTITKIQTTAGAHTTINVSSGAVAFNVPTKTSHLTNDSGFLTSHLHGNGAIDVSNNKISLNIDTKPAILIVKSTVNGISGLALILDDGSTDGESLFIPDGTGFYTGSQAIINQIPTKTSDLTNDSGFITSYTDTQVTSTAVTAATTLYLTGSTSTTTTGTLNKHASARISVSDSSTNNGYTRLILGNSTSNGAVGGKSGSIRLYSVTSYYSTIHSETIQSNCDITLPGSTGTLALTSDIPTSATEIGAVPTTRTVNGKALSADIADADYVTEEGTSSSWTYRKWYSGKVEAWRAMSFSSASSSVWASPIRYMDKTFTIPTSIFDASATLHIIATSPSNQYWIVGTSTSGSGSSSTISATLRLATVSSGNMATAANIYVWSD